MSELKLALEKLWPAGGPRTTSFRGKITTKLFALTGDVTLNLSGNKPLLKFGPEPAILHPCHLSGRKMAQISPPLTPLTPNSLVFMQKCYIYV